MGTHEFQNMVGRVNVLCDDHPYILSASSISKNGAKDAIAMPTR